MYDEGYLKSPCFWGTEPAGLVRAVALYFSDLRDARILDVGCGEGKNAYYLASLGAQVQAIDISQLAIRRAKALWPPLSNLTWEVKDILKLGLSDKPFDIILATGLLNCLRNKIDVEIAIGYLRASTIRGGFNVISVLNDRFQDLSGHSPDLRPCLLPHDFYIQHYTSWNIIHQSDTDLEDIHPHNNIPHKHSITRILAKNDNKINI